MPIECSAFRPYQEGIPVSAGNYHALGPDMLLAVRAGSVIKHNRSPMCIDTEGQKLLTHSSLDGVFSLDSPVWTASLRNINVSRTIALDGRCLLLDARYGKEFYHFTVSVLGRFAKFLWFDQFLDEVDYFLLPEPAPFVVKWAEMLQIPEERRVYLYDGMLVTTKDLVVPSVNNDIDYRTIAFLKNQLRPRHGQGDRNIFISRSKSVNGRHLIGEEDLIRDVIEPMGFEVVRLEEMTLFQQASTLASARNIVAVHGGGLTNLVYCRPGAKVLELFAPKWIVFCYARMCSLLGLRSFYYVSNEPNGFDVKIESKRLERILTVFLSQG